VGLSVNGLMNKNVIKSIGVLIVRILKLNKHRGLTFTAKYLKSCGLYVMKSVGMKNHKELHSCVYNDTKISICNDGLPRIIPVYLRLRIREGDTSAIRLILSICNLYRVLPYKGKVKLETITSPSKFFIREELDNYIPKYLNLIGVFQQPFSFHFDPFAIKSAGSVIEFDEDLYFYKGKK
jgi:hypothetical protein